MHASKFQSLIAALLLGSSLLGYASVARAQDSQSDSVADAARRAREAKKNSAKPATTKTSKVITNDDVPPSATSDAVNIGAPAKLETEPPNPSAVAATEAADQAAATGTESGKKPEDPEVAKAKAAVAEAEKQLDLLKRELALDQDTFYSNPDYAHDKAGQSKLADEQQAMNNKQVEVNDLKAKLQEVEARKGISSQAPAQPK
jgi:hypothetical protein